MEIYLPIAEMSVHWLVILGMGCGVGFLSGLFGVGGGFLLTPLLVFYGIPSDRRGGHHAQPHHRLLHLRRAWRNGASAPSISRWRA